MALGSFQSACTSNASLEVARIALAALLQVHCYSNLF